MPKNEPARLEALRQYRILDTAPEKSFDEVTRLASYICDTPVSLMTFVDEKRQWFKSKVGVDFTQSHRNDAFCAHTILDDKLMVVEDLRLDERFTDNPFVKHGPHVRFYAGAPLLTPEGEAVGTLCVVDIKPRRLTDEQASALRSLANLVGTQLELRRVSHELAETSADLKTLGELLPMCSYCKGVRDDQGYWKKVEAYIESHTGARMSHGLCPACATKHFPNYKLDGAPKAKKV